MRTQTGSHTDTQGHALSDRPAFSLWRQNKNRVGNQGLEDSCVHLLSCVLHVITKTGREGEVQTEREPS